MNLTTGIEWTDATSNPIHYRDKATGKDVWACVKTSPGCAHCYAETLAKRYGKGGPFTREAMAKVEPYFSEDEAKKILTSKKLAGKKVFIGDMTDVFGDWIPDAILDKLFAVFALRQDVTFQILTKRADRMAAYLNRTYARGYVADAAVLSFSQYVWWNTVGHGRAGNEIAGPEWPLPNVWCGVSVENVAALSRIDELRKTPAAVRFLSCEPLIDDLGRVNLEGIDLAIVGGESGPGARPCILDWIRSLVDQCEADGVACFVKQLGSKPIEMRYKGNGRQYTIDEINANGDASEEAIADLRRILDSAVQLSLRDRKGGDPSEWEEGLRIRQFPSVKGTV